MKIQTHTTRYTAKRLQVSERFLRRFLMQLGAIKKNQFGYFATPAFEKDGLLKTDTRTTQINFEDGRSMPKHYTVVLITDTGYQWLQERIHHKQGAA